MENILKVANAHKWSLCKNYAFIYIYNREYWNEIQKDDLQAFLRNAALKLTVPKYDAKYFQFVENLFAQFLTDAYLPKPKKQVGTVLVNLLNGTYEISPAGRKLRAFNQSDFLTYQLPFKFDPDTKSPRFQKFLNKVVPDPERQNILAEFLGYVFLERDTLKLEKTLILYGTGANGKSVFFEITSALFGKTNVSNYALQTLTDINGYTRAKLANKLVNYAPEISTKMESTVFKALVSGEPIEARLPYGDPFILENYAKLIFNCNELPQTSDHTNGFYKRFLIVPFDVTIPDSEQDAELAQKIISEELSGVFNWVLSGLDRLLVNRKFSDCSASEMALNTYRTNSDSVRVFLKEKEYQSSTVGQIDMKMLFSEYNDFCDEDNYRPVSKTNFKTRLQESGILIKKINRGNVACLCYSATITQFL